MKSDERREDGDEVLMKRVSEGDEEAFAALFERYEARLLGYCLRFLPDRAEAEEAVADAFLAVFRGRHTYRFPRPFRPWLFSIARNAALARLKRRGERPPENVSEPFSAAGDPVLETSRKEDLEKLADALRSLRPEFREVIRLYYFGGLTTPEIAEVLSIPPGTVRSRLSRGLAVLREAFSE